MEYLSKLNVLYNKADILVILGEYESAAENYKSVAKNGGGLWIADMSCEKLKKINCQSIGVISE